MVQAMRLSQVRNQGRTLNAHHTNYHGHARAQINTTLIREWMSSSIFNDGMSYSNTCLMNIDCHNENVEASIREPLLCHIEATNMHTFDLNQPPPIDLQDPECMFEHLPALGGNESITLCRNFNQLLNGDSCEGDIHSNQLQQISYNIGDVEKVNINCHLIHRVYPLRNNVRHLATLPLVFGDCLLHSLGDLSYECYHCKELSWRVDMKRKNENWVGKNCCSNGKISLAPLQCPPPALRDLLLGSDVESRAFRKNIRAYNSSLAFVYLGAHLDGEFTRGGGVYTFCIHGSTYHSIGPLVPNEGAREVPQFAQLYVYDTEHELQNRMHGLSGLDEHTLEKLQAMIHEYNPYAYSFRSMRETLQTNPNSELTMFIKAAHSRSRQYSVPIGSEEAAIMPSQGECSNVVHRDIHVNFRGGGLPRITNLHQSYIPLMYVL